MTRALYLDDGPGEARGVVTLDGRPERLLIARVYHRPEHQVGARLVGRIRSIDASLRTAFLDVGAAPDAVLAVSGAAKGVVEGAWIEIEVTNPPRSGKGAVARYVGPADGPARIISPAPGVREQLSRLHPGTKLLAGSAARDAADEAEAEALEVVHRLPSGGSVSIEPTRALVAIDVDVGAASGDARKAASRANREAIFTAARLLRLKGLGGPIVIDLAGRAFDGDLLRKVGESAFAPDQPGVVFGPIARFGLWSFVLPRRAQPVAEILRDGSGGPSDETLALRLLRQIEREAGPGGRIEVRCAPQVAATVQALAHHLSDRIGARFRIVGAPDRPRERPWIGPWEPA